MEKKYILEGLDCPNCAMKIERALNKHEDVENASVNAATLGCTIHYKSYTEDIEKELIHLIEDLEEVHVVKKDGHIHHEKACTCEHEHHHDHSCCKHEHHHEHECCNHDHHEHRKEVMRVQPAGKDLKKLKWKIEGLDCANCAMKVEDAVNEVEGVAYASLNFTTKTLLFYVKKNADENHIKEKVRKAILDAEEVEIIEGNEKKEKKKNYQAYILGTGIVVFVLSLQFDWQIGIILSYIMVGYSVIVKALKNIRRGEIFDENFLMLIATIGALVVGEYLEAVAVMLFYQLGEYFQNKAVERSRNSIADLMNIKAEIAHLKTNEQISDVDPEEIKIKDIIVVQPGERVPLDGVVCQGTTTLDTSALTGESLPREVSLGDEVLAGCINLQGVIEMRVTHELSESTVSRILDMVENASSKKARTELKMTRFARVYTPIVVIAALVLAIVPNFFQTQIGWQEWLLRACTFLVISCPCALVLSIPLGYFAGIGSASKKGILVKGGNYLEILSQIDTIVFDKTGTLTNGSFEVTNIYSEKADECLRLAAIAESYSTHPIALSIQKEYGKEVDKNEFRDVEEIAGHGIKGEYQGKILLAGNKKLMDRFHVACKEEASTGTLVYIAYDSKYVGTIEISDTLKPNTIESLRSLKEKGIKKLVMLTGDRQKTAQAIANECGIDEVHYELLPTDKVEELEKILKSASGKVAYVGDGINDAPVLARSDLGIAMGGLGSEAAVEASDLVLMKDNLSSLSQGIDLARFTQKIMNENIVFILGIKAIILGLSIFGYANMWLGVFADVGVSIIAVINAMRILKK